MNPFSTILAPGSPLARVSAQSRSRVRLVVSIVVAVSVLVLTALLIQGCIHAHHGATAASTAATNALASVVTACAPVVARSPVTISNAEPHVPLMGSPAATPKSAPVLAGAPAKNYSVLKGDNYYKIAKANGVSVNALAKANPGVEPTKLRVGQVLRIPTVSEKQTLPQTNLTHASAKGGGP
ncbi:MAG: LysM peptidoglycan-binding domain-containing protein [Verrucomicrobia bacterium]|nr:LysM peptidoglycan-binding domain-containing protein [Verrucomicrobiota bacterium]